MLRPLLAGGAKPAVTRPSAGHCRRMLLAGGREAGPLSTRGVSVTAWPAEALPEAPPGGRTRISWPTSIWLGLVMSLFQRVRSRTLRRCLRAIEYSVSPRSTR
ncbi:hypothetical protein D3C72_1224440 [compost metagenome]